MGCRSYHSTSTPWHTLYKLLLLMFIVGANFILTEGLPFERRGETQGMIPDSFQMESTPGKSSFDKVLPLRNLCTGGYISIRGRRIRTRIRDKPKPDNMLIMKSYDYGGKVTLQSNSSQQYICFNTKGKLTLRKKFRKSLCVFHERPADQVYGSYRYQLASRPYYYLGFRNNGKKLPGKLSNDPRFDHCTQFLKPTLQETPPASNGNGVFAPNVDFSAHFDLTVPKRPSRDRVVERDDSRRSRDGHAHSPQTQSVPRVNFKYIIKAKLETDVDARVDTAETTTRFFS